jgi:hypothetical protein
MPLDIMLGVMRGDDWAKDFSLLQIEMAIKAAPYCHPKLALKEEKHPGDSPEAVEAREKGIASIRELMKRLRVAEAFVAKHRGDEMSIKTTAAKTSAAGPRE